MPSLFCFWEKDWPVLIAKFVMNNWRQEYIFRQTYAIVYALVSGKLSYNNTLGYWKPKKKISSSQNGGGMRDPL